MIKTKYYVKTPKCHVCSGFGRVDVVEEKEENFIKRTLTYNKDGLNPCRRCEGIGHIRGADVTIVIERLRDSSHWTHWGFHDFEGYFNYFFKDLIETVETNE